MEIRTLRSFVGVASAGSISRAAEQLHVAQPALSLQIKNMEQELGASLFERTHKGVVTTVAGARFLGHAIDILKRLDVAYEEVRDAVNEPSGRVAVGLPQSLAQILTVPLVREIVSRWPEIQFQLIELSTGYIPEYLANGHIDLGLTFGREEKAGLHFIHLLDEDLVFVTSPDQLRSVFGKLGVTRTKMPFSQLPRFRLVLPTRAHSLRQRIDEYLTAEKRVLNVVAEVNTIAQLIEVAAAGVGSTILSHAAVNNHDRSLPVTALPIVGPNISRPVYLCRSASAPVSIAVSLVRDLIVEKVNSMVMSGQWLGAFRAEDACLDGQKTSSLS